MMFIVDDKVLAALPEDVQATLTDQAFQVPEDMEEEVELAAGMPKDDEGGDQSDPGDEISYGKEGEFKNRMHDDGSLADMPDSEKAKVGTLDDAGDRGMALLMALKDKEGPSKKLNGINKIPTKSKDEPVEVK